jgi:hypothetical protein
MAAQTERFLINIRKIDVHRVFARTPNPLQRHFLRTFCNHPSYSAACRHFRVTVSPSHAALRHVRLSSTSNWPMHLVPRRRSRSVAPSTVDRATIEFNRHPGHQGIGLTPDAASR